MNTTAEKIRILSTPGIKAEIQLARNSYFGLTTFRVQDESLSFSDDKRCTLMIRGGVPHDYVHMDVLSDHIEIWRILQGFILVKKISLDDVKILSAVYKGITEQSQDKAA